MPVATPVTPLLAEFGDKKVPEPETSVHTPLPIIGLLPFKVTVEVQIFELAPADATVGGRSLITATVEVDGGHVPLEIVHWKTLVPAASPTTPELGELGVVIDPLPEIKFHKPVPITGVFPAKFADDEQTVCVIPALETVGF